MPADPEAAPRWNHALWLGPLIAFVGLASYFLLFYRWPLFRDFPWANLLIVAGALVVSGIGLRRAFARGGWRIAAGVLGLVVSGLFATGLVLYCFVLSYQLPSSEIVVAEGEPFPAITRVAHDGRSVDLGADLGGRTIVVFFRGHW